MRICVFAFLAVFCVTPHAVAEELFSKCDDVLKQPDYSPLRKYLSDADKKSYLCQRLNNQEFLYTDFWTIYYCKSQKGVLSCSDHEEGVRFMYEDVVTRFSENNGKKFVLLRTDELHFGIASSGYHVFFLVPKSINPRGYEIFWLKGAGEYTGDAAIDKSVSKDERMSKACDGIYDKSMDDTTEAIMETRKPEIINQGSSNPIIRFTQERTLCKSGQVSRQILEYTWQGEQFLKTRDSREPIAKREGE